MSKTLAELKKESEIKELKRQVKALEDIILEWVKERTISNEIIKILSNSLSVSNTNAIKLLQAMNKNVNDKTVNDLIAQTDVGDNTVKRLEIISEHVDISDAQIARVKESIDHKLY